MVPHLPRTAALWLTGLLLTLSLCTPGFAHADTGGWSPPVSLSKDVTPDDNSWFPTVAADLAGNVYVVWNEYQPHVDLAGMSGLYFTRGQAGQWTRPNDIAVVASGDALRSSIAADPSGVLHLVYRGFGPGDTLLPNKDNLGQVLGPEDVYATAANGAAADSVHAWQPATRLTHSAVGYFTDVAIDSHGTIHVIWTEGANGKWGIYYSHSTDGGATWSPRVPLDGENPVWWYRAHLKVDGQDHLHVTWEVVDTAENGNGFGTTKDAYYAISTDSGQTWSKTQFAPEGPGDPSRHIVAAGPQQPAVGIDGKGNILLVYRDAVNDHILYRQSTDGTHWSAPALVPGVDKGVSRPYDIYDMATDSAGHVHLVMVGYPIGSATMSLLHSEWDGQQWSTADVIAGSPSYPEYPKIAIGQGNRLHVVWFVGDRATVDRNPIGIQYSTALTTAPVVSAPPGAGVSRAPAADATATALQASKAETQPAVLTPQPDIGPVSTAGWSKTVGQSSNVALLAGMGPVLLLVLVVVLAKCGAFTRFEDVLGRRS